MNKSELTRQHLVLQYLMENVDVTMIELRRKSIGGDAADVRLRELRRERGFDITYRKRIDANGKPTNTMLYTLNTPRELIDFENRCIKN